MRKAGRRDDQAKTYVLAVVTLHAWAVAQPLFTAWHRHPELLIAHRVGPASLLLLTVVALFAVPAAVILLGWLVRHVGDRAGERVLLRAAVGGLVGFGLLPVALRLAARLGLPSSARLAALLAFVALLVGLAVARAWPRRRSLRVLFNVLGLGLLVFPLAFWIREPIRSLWWPAATNDVLENRETSPDPAPDPALVVVVVLDELPTLSLLDRTSQLDAARFPGFAAWAATSTWYRNATTVADSTALAVPALLTGQRPRDRQAPVAAHHPDNLFTILGHAGLPLHVVETQTSLCPATLCATPSLEQMGNAWPTRFFALLADTAAVALSVTVPGPLQAHLGLPSVDRGWRDFWQPPRSLPSAPPTPGDPLPLPDAFRRLMVGLEQSPNGLHFAHVLLPHVPWHRLPDGTTYDGDALPGLVNQLWINNDWLITQAYQRHLLQLAYVDALLARLHRQMGEQGALDRALVVITADHGVAFTQHQPWRRITAHNAAEIANVPLLIKRPRQRSAVVDDRAAELIDVLPTVLGELRGTNSAGPNFVAPTLDGHDLDARSWNAARGQDQRHVFVTRLQVEATRLDLPRDWPAQRRARLDWKIMRFGDDDRSLFAVGPHLDLLGQPIAPLSLTTAHATARVSFDGPAASPLSPRIVGQVHGVAPGTVIDLAVAAAGVIRASTRTFSDRGAVRFTAMLDPAVFDPVVLQPTGSTSAGAHPALPSTLSLYWVKESSDGVTLTPLPTQPAP